MTGVLVWAVLVLAAWVALGLAVAVVLGRSVADADRRARRQPRPADPQDRGVAS